MYEKAIVKELFEKLESLEKDEGRFYLNDWIEPDFLKELFFVMTELYLENSFPSNISFNVESTLYVQEKKALIFLQLLDRSSLDLLSQLSNGSAHELVSLIKK